MADTDESLPNIPAMPHPYEDEEYQKNRQAALGIIPRSNVYSAISRNAGTIFTALITAATAAIVAGVIHVPALVTAVLVGGGLLAAGISAYASFKDETLSKTVGTSYNEANEIAKARLNGREMARAIKETLGGEIDEIRQETRQTQQAVARLNQKVSSWQEREAAKDETIRTLQ